MKRTHHCNELRAEHAGQTVTLTGWVHSRRDLGGLLFIDLRDREGRTQTLFDPADLAKDVFEVATHLHSESVIEVTGKVRVRPAGTNNDKIPTGQVEVLVQSFIVLNNAEVLPFPVDDPEIANKVNEELRLQYRYLDLRRPEMIRNLRLRSKVAIATRSYMDEQGFLEVETPTLFKSTPEGAREFLVPNRRDPGTFYALPQSPQQFKQILMVSGVERYFQLARCYRDEDARGDRQPEFTQVDIEMSFVKRDDVLELVEGMMGHVFRKTLGVELPAKFRRIAYDDSIELYGTDKPDLRFGMEMKDFGELAAKSGFQAFKDALAEGAARQAAAKAKGITQEGGAVKALLVPGKADYSRKQIEELEAAAKIYRAKGMAWMKVNAEGRLEGGASKFFAGEAAPAGLEAEVVAYLGAKPGDLIILVADAKRRVACVSLGAVRSKLGKDLGFCDPKRFEFAWIVDFPMFEYNEEEAKWDTAHHMFTMPQEKYHPTLESDPGAVKGDLYDLVMNGFELASGSIRIHDPELQKRIFSIVGFDPAEAERKFGFLTEAFKYGPPPHGGIAPGLDRLVMLMAGETSIKEVIAFPKNSFAVSPMDESPNEVDAKQLEELSIRIVEGADGAKTVEIQK